MFEACAYYESTSESRGFEMNDEPVWILGKKYSTQSNLDELHEDVRSRIWCTYRKNFPPIGQSGMTSDRGWGCMLRCGQMVMAQSLVNLHLSRDWRWPCEDVTMQQNYFKILKMFSDRKSAAYSIHQMALMGESEGKIIGEWFGPNTVAQVLRKLSVYDEWSNLQINVALDNTVILEDIENLCGGVMSDVSCSWSPLLLIVQLRLGLIDINPIYVDSLKECLQLPQSVGMIGGKPSQALYFIGYTGEEVVYLDPHVTQSVAEGSLTESDSFDDSSYHTELCSRMNFSSMDPSLAVCFLCTTREEWEDLCDSFRNKVNGQKQALFEICAKRPAEWQPLYEHVELFEHTTSVDSDSDEEFEILG